MSELQNFVKESLLLNQIVTRTSQAARYGSFSERNPTLGKMINCQLCGRQHRTSEVGKCGTHWNPHKFENEPQELCGNPPHPKRKNPRLTRNRPPLFLVHQLLKEIEAERRPELENVPEHALPAYIEKKVKDWREAKDKKKRDQQKLSRRINRT